VYEESKVKQYINKVTKHKANRTWQRGVAGGVKGALTRHQN